jgi:hypothetical protein
MSKYRARPLARSFQQTTAPSQINSFSGTGLFFFLYYPRPSCLSNLLRIQLLSLLLVIAKPPHQEIVLVVSAHQQQGFIKKVPSREIPSLCPAGGNIEKAGSRTSIILVYHAFQHSCQRLNCDKDPQFTSAKARLASIEQGTLLTLSIKQKIANISEGVN